MLNLFLLVLLMAPGNLPTGILVITLFSLTTTLIAVLVTQEFHARKRIPIIAGILFSAIVAELFFLPQIFVWQTSILAVGALVALSIMIYWLYTNQKISTLLSPTIASKGESAVSEPPKPKERVQPQVNVRPEVYMITEERSEVATPTTEAVH